jgi:hypothetical protein
VLDAAPRERRVNDGMAESGADRVCDGAVNHCAVFILIVGDIERRQAPASLNQPDAPVTVPADHVSGSVIVGLKLWIVHRTRTEQGLLTVRARGHVHEHVADDRPIGRHVPTLRSWRQLTRRVPHTAPPRRAWWWRRSERSGKVLDVKKSRRF